MLPYPQNFTISSGVATSRYQMVAFDAALIDAGISNYNLLRVSSILPVGCRQTAVVDKKEGSALLVAYGTISSNVSGQTIASAIGVGIPEDNSRVGVIMEFAGECDAETARQIVREMVSEAMSNHGIPCREILDSAAEIIVPESEYASVISSVALW